MGGAGAPGGGGGDPGSLTVPAGDNTYIIKTKSPIALNLPPLPNVNTPTEWMQNVRRKVSTAVEFTDEAYQWINAATTRDTTADELRLSSAMTRDLNMKLAADLLQKATQCRSQGDKAPDHQVYDLSVKLCMEEEQLQQKGILMNGREMVHFIVRFHAVRHGFYQFFHLRDLLKIKFECKEKERERERERELDEKFPPWFDVWRDIYNKTDTEEFNHQMRETVLQHLHEQTKKIPMLARIMSKYYFSDGKPGTGIKTYKWLENRIIELLARMRGDKNEMFQSSYLRDLAQGKMSFLPVPAAVGTEADNKGGKDKGKGDKGKAAKRDFKGGKPKGKAK